jgi:OOP family OmpA-OmpF porin
MKVIRIAALLGTLLAAGCASNDEQMAQATPGSPFTQALAAEYRDFVAEEREEYDWKAGKYYSRKEAAAANGEAVLPEEITGVNESHGRTLDEARGRLMSPLSSGARDNYPQFASQAQVAFDCWLHETQEVDSWLAAGQLGEDHTAECHDQFEAAMAAMVPKPAEPIAVVAPHEYMVLFDLDKSDIRSDARSILDQVLADASAQGLSRVNISATGHADRSGSEDYNMTLSMRRADAVRDALIAGGIPAENITVAGRGESENAIPTTDGIVEQANRRVEIIVQ